MMDKEIIKILNTATNIDGLQICCIDYENDPETKTFLSIKSDIVDLINRQQAKIEVLVEDTLCLRDTLKENESLRAEIERLTKECGNQSALWSKHYEGIFETAKETIKSEAIKEFWGRLQGIAYQSSDWSHGEHPMVVELDDVEEIYDEMVGEQE